MILVRMSDENHEIKGITLGIKISQWCKEQGLEHQKDFEWWLGRNAVFVRFDDGYDSLSSYLLLMWQK